MTNNRKRETGFNIFDERGIMLTKDHIIPISLGGSKRSLDNQQTMCSLCNGKKGHNVSKSDILRGVLSNGKNLIKETLNLSINIINVNYLALKDGGL